MAEKPETAQKTVWQKLQNIPKNILYIIVIIVLVVPIFMPLGLPISIAQSTMDFYNTIENLPRGSRVFLMMGIGFALYSESGYTTEAVTEHLLSKGLKVYVIDVAIAGSTIQITIPLLDRIGKAKGYKYGTDYVHLGYVAGGEIAIASLAVNLWEIVVKDVYGTPLSEIPMMAGAHVAKDFNLLIVASTDLDTPLMWLRQWQTTYNIPSLGIYHAAQGSLMMPYYPGQLKGIVSGIRGGAEYELLIKKPGAAIRGLDQANLSSIYILVIILMGNIGYFMEKRRK